MKIFKTEDDVYCFIDKTSLNPASFYNEEIVSKDEITPLLPFVYQKTHLDNARVNIFDVVGLVSSDCGFRTWGDFISNSPKMKDNISLLLQSPEYYLKEQKKTPLMRFIQIKDRVFVENDGMHRIALAKLLFSKIGQSELSGIELVHCHIDYQFKRAYEKLLSSVAKSSFEVELLSDKTLKQESRGICKEDISLSVRVHDSKKEWILGSAYEIDEFIYEAQNVSFFKRLLRRA